MYKLLIAIFILLNIGGCNENDIYRKIFGNDHCYIDIRPTQKQAWVYMRHPSKGMVTLGKISYDCKDCENVEEMLFDAIRRNPYDGELKVCVCFQEQDKYGYWSFGRKGFVASILQASEVKKYKSYRYFEGNAHIPSTYYWNQH